MDHSYRKCYVQTVSLRNTLSVVTSTLRVRAPVVGVGRDAPYTSPFHVAREEVDLPCPSPALHNDATCKEWSIHHRSTHKIKSSPASPGIVWYLAHSCFLFVPLNLHREVLVFKELH